MILRTNKNEGTHGPSSARGARKVMMLGLRGIPNVQGGVEKHVEMLAGALVSQGWEVEVVGRRRYVARSESHTWRGVGVTSLWAPRRMELEALVHTFIGVLYAAVHRPHILHIHAIGPALLVSLARLLGLKVLVTHHGYDYDRQKWGGFARTALKLGERIGMNLSHGRIAVSRDIARTMNARYGVTVDYVPNGVAVTHGTARTGVLDEFDLVPRRYILLAARFVPEKRQVDLIRAFARLDDPNLRLVLVGDAEFETPYALEARRLAAATPGVILTGFQSGDRLAEIFANAGLFVLPSSHEGMPIALLEALAYGLPVLASDIVANKELDLPGESYFPLGDIDALALAMARKFAAMPSEDEMRRSAVEAANTYSWSSVAGRTDSVYRTVLGDWR
jgi:glycosyltransferase involved in cell wall biosynthesis